MKIGSAQIDRVMMGSVEVSRVYLGTQIVHDVAVAADPFETLVESLPWHYLVWARDSASNGAPADGATVSAWTNAGSDTGNNWFGSAVFRQSHTAMNARPVLDFAGGLSLTCAATMLTGTDTTLVVIGQMGSGMARNATMWSKQGSAGSAIQLANSSRWNWSTTAAGVFAMAGADALPHVMMHEMLSTGTVMWQGPQLTATDTDPTTRCGGVVLMAGAGPGEGVVALAGLVPRALSAQERSDLFALAATYYGTV